MVFSALRFVAIIIISLALCTQSGIVSAALAVNSAADACCPAGPAGPAEEGARCAQPDCQCFSCVSVVLPEVVVSIAGLTEVALAYHEAAPPLTGDVYFSIDYPPESA